MTTKTSQPDATGFSDPEEDLEYDMFLAWKALHDLPPEKQKIVIEMIQKEHGC